VILDNIPQISSNRVQSIEWQSHDLMYDLQLYELGSGLDEFIVINPDRHIEKSWHNDLKHYIDDIPDTRKCIVFTFEGNWVAKVFKGGWYPYHGYESIEIPKPKVVWRKNPDLDKLMTFENDPFAVFEPNRWDIDYTLVWYIDPRVNPLPDKVWAMTCEPLGAKVKGIKDMGYVMPEIDVELNDQLPDIGIDPNKHYPAYWELDYTHIYELDPIYRSFTKLWVIKYTPAYRIPKDWRWAGAVAPVMEVEYNPDLGNLNYDIDYVIPWHDFTFEHIWMLDNIHLVHGEDKEIWAFKIKMSKDIKGSRVVDYISPVMEVEYNPDLGNLNYDIDYVIPWHDFKFEHVWMLDNIHLVHGEDKEIWAFKIKMSKDIEGSRVVDYISPSIKTEINPEIKGLTFDIDYVVPWYDLEYEHVWMLDRECYPGHEPIWAVKQVLAENVVGNTNVGEITPKQTLVFNKSLKNLHIEINYKIPYHDRYYEHIWYTEINNELIWSAKLSAVSRTTGVKDMGRIDPILPKHLDVIFISYYEPDAEINWKRVLEKAPYAKRIDGVKGIFNAHKAAARLSETDMFYVVDGDAWLTDNWTFDFQPVLYDRKYTFIWHSQNPINGLVYGYGGVKLFSKDKIVRAKKWTTLDFATTVMDELKVVNTVSNISKFNTDEFSTWRSAFRECVKLQVNLLKNPNSTEDKVRLDAWASKGADAEFGQYSIDAANAAVEFVNSVDAKELLKINDRAWLKQKFQSIYGGKIK
jgi:hypothetical protein